MVDLTIVTTRGKKALMVVRKDFIISGHGACYDKIVVVFLEHY